MEDHTQLLVRTAQLYYEAELNQSEIADILRVSRPTVSRILEEAKKEGVVEIIVHDPIRKNASLSNALRRRFSLRDAVVISGNYDYDKALERCCEAALQLFNTILKNGLSIGISWGSVPQLLCQMIEPKEFYNLTVIQMVGCLGTGNPNVDGLELAIQLSRKLGGTYSNIYAPIYVESAPVRDYLIREPQIEATIKKAMHTDVIITGVGSLDEKTTIQRAGYWKDKDREDLISRGAVGHLLGRPYDRDGNPVEWKNRFVIGAPLDAMFSAEWSIAVAANKVKADATLAAIKRGYVNTLIADEELAEELLAMA